MHIRPGIRYVLLTRKMPRSDRDVPLLRQLSHHDIAERPPSDPNTARSKLLTWPHTWVDGLAEAGAIRAILLCLGLCAFAPLVVPLLIIDRLQFRTRQYARPSRFFYDLDDDLIEQWDLVVDAWRGLELDGARVTSIAYAQIDEQGVTAFDQLPDAEPTLRYPRGELQVEVPTWSRGRASLQLRPDGIHRRDANSLVVFPWSLVDMRLLPPRSLTSASAGSPPTGVHFADEGQRLQELLLSTENGTVRELHQALRAYIRGVLPASNP